MYRTVRASLAAAVVLALAPAARAADEPKDVIAKAIKAHGGEEFLTKHKAAHIRDKGKITLPGTGTTDYASESSFMLPDRFKQVIEMEIMGAKFVMNALVVGDKVNLDATVAGMKIDLGADAAEGFKDVTLVLGVMQLVPLVKDKKYELSPIGDDKVDGKDVVGVRVSGKGQKDVSLYFDKTTHLLTKLEYRTKGPDGMEVTETHVHKEYGKTDGGVPYSKKSVILHDGKTFLESETVEYKHVEKLDDSEFKK